MNTKLMTFALLAVLIALLTYKVGPKLVPAMVGSSVVTRFELWSRLEKSYGVQVLDDMVNEKILDKAILDSKIKVDQAKVDEQIKTLETQFESTGGLEEALKQRGLSRADLEKQIKTQLAVEEILADKITPTGEEVQAQFDAGSATVYKDKKLEEVKDGITEELKQTKLRDEFLVWFGEVKKSVKVKNYGL
jgi:foldase protein PrsA